LDLKTSGIYFQSHFNEEYIQLLTFLPNRLLLEYRLEQTVFEVPSVPPQPNIFSLVVHILFCAP
jgi:hypothetical protein